MSDNTRESKEETVAPGSHDEPARPDTPPTPFDHPLFLPALLAAGMLWFGYDGWINQDPDMLEHNDFNRYGFAVLSLLTAWFGYKGFSEWQQEKAAKQAGDD